MKPNLITTNSSRCLIPIRSLNSFHLKNANSFHKTSISTIYTQSKPSRFVPVCSISSSKSSDFDESSIRRTNSADSLSDSFVGDKQQSDWNVEVAIPKVPSYLPLANLSLSDQAFFLLSFIACTTSVAFTSLVIAAVPTLFAMGRAATALSKLADTAREELPSTMAAIRLSGMEISDLTLELSDLRGRSSCQLGKRKAARGGDIKNLLFSLNDSKVKTSICSQEIADGVNKSAQAVQAAEAGIRQIGSLARQQTMSMIQERASLPIISFQPVVAGAAKKTSRAVGQATKNLMNMISGGDFTSKDDDESGIDRLDI